MMLPRKQWGGPPVPMTWWYVLGTSLGLAFAVLMCVESIRQLLAVLFDAEYQVAGFAIGIGSFGVLVSLATFAVVFLCWKYAVVAYWDHR